MAGMIELRSFREMIGVVRGSVLVGCRDGALAAAFGLPPHCTIGCGHQSRRRLC
jgi:hypothetical protein